MNIYELNNPIFKDVVLASLDGIICSNEEGNIILFNPAAEKMFGYSADDVMGKPLTMLMLESARAAHLAGYKKLIESEKMSTSGRTLRTDGIKKDGTVFTHDMSLAAERIDGRWVIVGILRDWTENIQLHEALKSNTYFLAQSEHVASLGTYALDISGGLWSSSVVLDQIFGIDEHFARNVEGWLSLVHVDDREEMQRYLAEDVLTEHHVFDHQYRIVRRSDGTERWLHGRGELTFDAAGQPVSMAGTIQDITVQKLADDKLRQLTCSVEQAGESILITNRQGIIEYVNPAFTELTGYSSEEAVGRSPVLLNSGKQDKAFYAELWNTILSGKTWRGSVINRKKDGTLYPAMLTISPSTNENDEVTHFIGIQNDLTEFRALEDKFHQAQKMEAIGTLVGGIAHDFNNLLAGITGNLYLATKQVQDKPDVVRKLANIEQLSMRAADMIQQLLTFARKGKVSMQSLPLTLFTKEAMKLLQASVPENVRLHQEISSTGLLIKGDATQIHQVMMNLVNNARDALENTGNNPQITIRLEACQASDIFAQSSPHYSNKSYAHLSVQDNGCGIPEHQIKRLFEPFFSTKEQGKGTGLGLSMVFGAIKTHQGLIEVESHEGEGSTFHIYIPLLEAQEVSDTVHQKERASEGHGELVLLADDEKHVRETTAEVLKTLGYKVLQVEDGLQTVETFKAHQHDIAIVILDVVMPHLGGAELALRLRQLNPDVPIIFVTGYDKGHVLGSDEQVENSSILTKPVNYRSLSQNIKRMLR